MNTKHCYFAGREPKLFIVKEITLRHRNRQLLSDLNFLAEPGKLCCIVGPSGSGKTALFEVLADINPSTEGNVFFGNHSLLSSHDQKVRG
jgi:ABC-type cobalamin/Fe3+-siderophores transport system ATPase subunit